MMVTVEIEFPEDALDTRSIFPFSANTIYLQGGVATLEAWWRPPFFSIPLQFNQFNNRTCCTHLGERVDLGADWQLLVIPFTTRIMDRHSCLHHYPTSRNMAYMQNRPSSRSMRVGLHYRTYSNGSDVFLTNPFKEDDASVSSTSRTPILHKQGSLCVIALMFLSKRLLSYWYVANSIPAVLQGSTLGNDNVLFCWSI